MEDKHLKELLEVLLSVAKDKAALITFLKDLLTPAELEEFVRRWQIVKLLYLGLTQREVALKLHVSIATVSRGARMLHDPKGGFNRILKRKRDRKKSFFDKSAHKLFCRHAITCSFIKNRGMRACPAFLHHFPELIMVNAMEQSLSHGTIVPSYYRVAFQEDKGLVVTYDRRKAILEAYFVAPAVFGYTLSATNIKGTGASACDALWAQMVYAITKKETDRLQKKLLAFFAVEYQEVDGMVRFVSTVAPQALTQDIVHMIRAILFKDPLSALRAAKAISNRNLTETAANLVLSNQVYDKKARVEAEAAMQKPLLRRI